MAAEKRKRGRPKDPDAKRRRRMIGVRLREETRERLEVEAADAGRSLSQEVEHRIEQRNDRRALLQDVLESVYGIEVAALVCAMATAARGVQMAIGFHNRSLGAPAGAGLDDPRTFSEVAKAIGAVLDDVRPKGEPEPLVAEQRAGRTLVDGAAAAREFMADLRASAFRKEQWAADTLMNLGKESAK